MSELKGIASYYKQIHTSFKKLKFYEIGSGKDWFKERDTICAIPYACRLFNDMSLHDSNYNDHKWAKWSENRPLGGASI